MPTAAAVPRRYLFTAAALMGLLALTFGAHFLPVGPRLHLALALGIAAAKAALIAGVFMHLRRGSALVRLFAGAGLVWMLLLFALTLADYLTRGLLPAP